ncbi:hypothetical protein JM946_14190 [Steroidobacter sp. S1-65]|uniref:Uncharacterized protein n=1 Tax=Steroidobacter gossypii TaxID=2805490 RepID=A0ABS1WY15_9GAMM|nr:hypothetical protein [Steroidobacter gossypii]MBM0105877.1 hypothetical protein [Steroidobacter gossypii]
MAKRDSTTDEAKHLNSDPPSSLRDIIEQERTRLQTALTVLGCTKVSINNDQCADGHQFMYGDMIELARQMIDETTDQLDLVYLRGFYDQLASHPREGLIRVHASMQDAPSAGGSAGGVSAA